MRKYILVPQREKKKKVYLNILCGNRSLVKEKRCLYYVIPNIKIFAIFPKIMAVELDKASSPVRILQALRFTAIT